MYKIMIADDEGIVIDGLRFLLEREFGDKCIVESAKSGRSVIELAESFRPDIALMDIQMPGINGIEAMKEIRKTCPDMIFIVISAYDRFDYAKEALELGVMDYLNKPIDKKILVERMNKAFMLVDKSKEKRKSDLKVKEKLETVIPVIENGFIYSILFQDDFSKEIENYKQLLGMTEGYGYVMVLKFGDEEADGELVNTVGASVRIQKQYNMIRSVIKEHFDSFVGALMGNTIVAYIPRKEPDKEREYEERMEEIETARKMVRSLKKHIDAKFRAGIGSVRPLDEATISYSEAMSAFHVTSGSVAHVKDLPIGCEFEGSYPVELEKGFFEGIEIGNLEDTLNYANRFMDWMFESYSSQEYFYDCKLKCLEFVIRAEKIAYDKGGMVYTFLSRSGYLKALEEITTQTEMRSWFLAKIRHVCQNINQKREESSSSIVERAKEYIRLNFHKDISLDDVSREVNISSYYFSKLFKEEAGENFIDFLTAVRMEEAKRLLATTDKSMKEICGEIGYGDPNYFSRTFKKNIGVTPSEFKESV